LTGQRPDLAGESLDARIEPAPVSCQVLDDAQHAGREDISARRQDAWQLGAQETQPLPHRDASLQQEGADLIDDAGTLTDQPLAHTVERLQVELFGSLGCDELHGRALHGLGDGLRIAESRSSVPSNTAARTSPASAEYRAQASAAFD
jgi:hypothetical protein